MIEKSSQAPEEPVNVPGTDEQAKLSDISKSGGVINALEAAKLAATIEAPQPEKQKRNRRAPKSVLENRER